MPEHGDPDDPVLWVTFNDAWIVAGVFAWLAIILTCVQIYLHLKYYNNAAHQKWIVRILFMVPIYAFASWMSLKYFHDSIYFDTVRNVYEAFVIYNFLALCYEYLGGESTILTQTRGRMNRPAWWTCTCCCKPFPYDLKFLLLCKQGTLQFCVVKPFMAVVTIVAVMQGSFHDGDLSPSGAFLYISIVYNTSITIALCAMILFYAATRDLLARYKPVAKFLIIKSIVFLSFWQGVALAAAEKIGLIKNFADIEAGEVSTAWQNFLICIEMFFAAVGLLWAFPHKPYKTKTKPTEVTMTTLGNLTHTLNPSDMVSDTIRNFAPQYKTHAALGQEEYHVEEPVDTTVDDDHATAVAMAAMAAGGKRDPRDQWRGEKVTLLQSGDHLDEDNDGAALI